MANVSLHSGGYPERSWSAGWKTTCSGKSSWHRQSGKRDRQVRWRGQGAPPDATPRPGQQPDLSAFSGRRDRGHRHRDPRPDLVEQGQHQRHRPDALVRPLFAANPAAHGSPGCGKRSKRPSRPSIPRSTGSTPAPFLPPHCRLRVDLPDGGNTISGRLVSGISPLPLAA